MVRVRPRGWALAERSGHDSSYQDFSRAEGQSSPTRSQTNEESLRRRREGCVPASSPRCLSFPDER